MAALDDATSPSWKPRRGRSASWDRPRSTPARWHGLARVVDDHRDAIAREAAVAALGALGDPSGLPAVLAACSDRAAVRRRAVLALAPFDGPEVDAALGAALDDKDWQVRQAAEDLTSGAT